MENIWVSVYAFLFAMIPLLLVGVSLSSSLKSKRRLKRADDPEKLRRIYLKMRKKIKCKAIGGMIFFVLTANFLLLYIICFCHVANTRMSEDWVRSSAILLVLDLLIMELMGAVLYAILGVAYR